MRKRLQFLLRPLDSRYAIYWIVALGLTLRVLGLVWRAHVLLHSDARGYDLMALQLLHKVRFSPFWPPGLPYYLAFFHALCGEGAGIARASLLPVYVALSFLLLFYGKLISNRRAGNLAALAFAVYPASITYSVDPLTEFPAATLLLALVFTGTVACQKVSRTLSAATGLLLGLLVLVRPSSILLLIFIPFFFYLKTKRLGMAGLPFIISAILISSWLWKLQNLTGRFVWISDSTSMDLFLGNNPYTPLYKIWPGGQAESGFPREFTTLFQHIRTQPPEVQDAMYRRIAMNHILSRPDQFLVRTFSRIRAYFAFPTFRAEGVTSYFRLQRERARVAAGLTFLNGLAYVLIMVLALLFLFNLPGASVRSDQMIFALGSILAYSLPCWLIFSNPRLHFPVFPFFATFASGFVDDLAYGRGVEALNLLALSTRRRYGLLFVLAFFLYIQTEWAWVMYQGA